MMKTQTRTRLWKNERGIASFLVTFVLMLVITLVTLTFAQIIRREQRQALDRNLSARAFYAAESGINSAVYALSKGYAGDKPDCRADGSGLLDKKTAYELDTASDTELNCLTIDATPTSLEYPLPMRKSLVVPIFAQSNMDKVELSWQSTTATSTTSYAACSAAKGFTPQNPASWTCTAPVLRIDLIDVSGGVNRASLGNGFSVFMYPTAGSGTTTINYSSGSSSNMINALCAVSNASATVPYHCRATIKLTSSSRSYYARVVAYYMDAKLAVTPKLGSSDVELAGAQAVIDSTGKAQDVTRRLQVRKSLSGTDTVPEFGLESAAGLCKRYLVMAGNGAVGSSVVTPQTGNTLTDGSPCALTPAL